MGKKPEDMNRDERKQAVEQWMRERQEGINRVPLLSPEASRGIDLPDLRSYLAEAERKRQRRFHKWIDEGGAFPKIFDWEDE